MCINGLIYKTLFKILLKQMSNYLFMVTIINTLLNHSLQLTRHTTKMNCCGVFSYHCLSTNHKQKNTNNKLDTNRVCKVH